MFSLLLYLASEGLVAAVEWRQHVVEARLPAVQRCLGQGALSFVKTTQKSKSAPALVTPTLLPLQLLLALAPSWCRVLQACLCPVQPILLCLKACCLLLCCVDFPLFILFSKVATVADSRREKCSDQENVSFIPQQRTGKRLSKCSLLRAVMSLPARSEGAAKVGLLLLLQISIKPLKCC